MAAGMSWVKLNSAAVKTRILMQTDAKFPNYCDGSMSMLLKKQAPLSSKSMQHERIILNE